MVEDRPSLTYCLDTAVGAATPSLGRCRPPPPFLIGTRANMSFHQSPTWLAGEGTGPTYRALVGFASRGVGDHILTVSPSVDAGFPKAAWMESVPSSGYSLRRRPHAVRAERCRGQRLESHVRDQCPHSPLVREQHQTSWLRVLCEREPQPSLTGWAPTSPSVR